MALYNNASGTTMFQGFHENHASSRVCAPPGGGAHNIFMDDVKMLKMQSRSPTTQRRVLSGASRKQQNNSGLFQNDIAMLQRGSPAVRAGAGAGTSRGGQQAAAIGGYSNIFQNDLQMTDPNNQQPPSRTPASVHSGSNAAPWNAGIGRTASPVPVRRVVGPRNAVPGAAGLNTGMTRMADAAPSPAPAPSPASAPSHQPAPPQSAAEIRAAEKAKFLADRKQQRDIAKAKQLRLSNVANAASALAGERLDGLLAKAARQDALDEAAVGENVAPPQHSVPFAGHLKGSKPKRPVARGAPRCAAAAPKPGSSQKRAVSATSTASERKAASARSRSKARSKAKLDAERKANSSTKGIKLKKNHRNSSRVLAPPGGKSSISFN